VVVGPCLVFTDERDERNFTTRSFFLSKEGFGVVLFSLFYSNWIGSSISQRLVFSPFGLWTNRQILGADALTPRTRERYRTKTGDSLSTPGSLHLHITRPNIYPLLPSPHHIHPILLGPFLDMSMQALQSLYSRLRSSPTASHVDLLCVFASLDGLQFHSYPPSIFGLSPDTFESVLPNLGTKLAVQASSPMIHAAIREA